MPTSVAVSMIGARSRHSGGSRRMAGQERRRGSVRGGRGHDLARPALLPGGPPARPLAGLVRVEAEQERALDRVGLDQLDLDPVAQREGLAGALPDQRLMALVELERVVAQGRDRDQAIGTGLVQAHEQPEIDDRGHAGGNTVPTRSARNSAISRSKARRSASMALRSVREMLAQAREMRVADLGAQAVLAQPQLADQGRGGRRGRCSAGSAVKWA